MAHPYQQTETALALAFEHAAVCVVIDELRQTVPIAYVRRAAIIPVDRFPERVVVMEIVQGPLAALRP